MKRRYWKIATSYFITVLTILMFLMMLIGNCLGLSLIDSPSDSTTKTPETSTVDSSPSITEKNINLSKNNSSLTEIKEQIKLEDYYQNERIVPIEEISSKVEEEFGNVSSGETKEIITENSKEGIVITEVQLTAVKNLTDLKMTVIELKDKPEHISLRLEKNESVYQYLDIKLTSDEEYVAEDDIDIMKFNFKVKQSWIAENNIDKNTILLIRYHNGEWQNLSTMLVSENDIYVIFEAETPGCSTFAVIGSALVEIPEPYVSKTPEIPWTVVIGVITSTTIILVTVLFKARYIYFEENPLNKGLKEKIERKNKIGKK